MAELPYRLSVQLEDMAFSAEGDKSQVSADYHRFMQVAEARLEARRTLPPGAHRVVEAPQATVPAEPLYRNESGVLILAQGLPGLKPIDHLLILVFVYAQETDSEWVLATRLCESARRSHVKVARLHRVLGSSGLVRKKGKRRSTTYSLTRAGRQRVEDLLELRSPALAPRTNHPRRAGF